VARCSQDPVLRQHPMRWAPTAQPSRCTPDPLNTDQGQHASRVHPGYVRPAALTPHRGSPEGPGHPWPAFGCCRHTTPRHPVRVRVSELGFAAQIEYTAGFPKYAKPFLVRNAQIQILGSSVAQNCRTKMELPRSERTDNRGEKGLPESGQISCCAAASRRCERPVAGAEAGESSGGR
jgi:hypothetical protein